MVEIEVFGVSNGRPLDWFEPFLSEFALRDPLIHPILWFWQQKTDPRSPKITVEIFENCDFSVFGAQIIEGFQWFPLENIDFPKISRNLVVRRAG